MDEPKPSTSKGVKIKAPEGFEWPEDVDPDKGEKYLVTAISDPEDNTWIWLTDIDGLPLKGEPEKPKPPAPDEEMSAGDVFAKTLKDQGV